MNRRDQVLAIDLLRFVAAAGVVAYHLAVARLLPGATIELFMAPAAMPPTVADWAWPGWIGVEVFFVISGFVIARSALGIDRATFLRRRVLRLAPAAWVCATLTAATLVAAGAYAPRDLLGRWLSALLFLPTQRTIDGSYWTLEVELAFYLVAALALARPGRDRTPALIAALGAASIVFWSVAMPLGWAVHDFPPTLIVDVLLLPHGVFFALGMLLARTHRSGWTMARIGGAMVLLAAAAIEIAERATQVAGLPGPGRPAWIPILLFAGAVAAIACAATLQPMLRRWPGERTLRVLGRVTYPLYLLHQVIGMALVAMALDAGASLAVALAGSGAAVLALAFLVSERIEPGLRARVAAMLTPRRARSPDTIPSASLPAG